MAILHSGGLPCVLSSDTIATYTNKSDTLGLRDLINLWMVLPRTSNDNTVYNNNNSPIMWQLQE